MTAVGDYILVQYDDPLSDLWHERLVIGLSDFVGWFCVVTPTNDIFMELCDASSNEDLAGIRHLSGQGAAAYGVPVDRVFRFHQAPTAAEMADLVVEGARQVASFNAPDGAHRARPVAAPLPPAMNNAGGALSGGVFVPRDMAPGGVWLVAAPGCGMEIGDEVSTQPSFCVGCRGVVAHNGHEVFVEYVTAPSIQTFKTKLIDAMAAEIGDIRILPVRYTAGKRMRVFSEAVDLVEEEPGLDGFPEGPRTMMTDLMALKGTGLTLQTFTQSWVESVGVPKGDRSIYEMEVLGEILHAMLCVDQLNIGNLVSAAIAMRRRAVIVDAHKISPSNPDYSCAEIMMGLGGRRGTQGVSMALQSYTATRLRDHYAVQKEKRKAQEEQSLRKKGGNKEK